MVSGEELDKLRLAFAVHTAHRVVLADGLEDPRELTVIGQIFPRSMLLAAGLCAEDGSLVGGLESLAARAGEQLSALLPLSERLDLITLLFLTATADGRMPDSELSVIEDAAARLGITDTDRDLHLRRLAAEAADVA